MSEKEKTQVDDINRSMYDFRYEENEDFYRIKSGLTPDIVETLSKEKGDPEWMREFRLNSLKIYNELKVRGYHVDVGVVSVFDTDKNRKKSFKKLRS